MKLDEFKRISVECGLYIAQVGWAWACAEPTTTYAIGFYRDGQVEIYTKWVYNTERKCFCTSEPVKYKEGISCKRFKKHLMIMSNKFKKAKMELKKQSINEDFV
jgi:hypothetical protein